MILRALELADMEHIRKWRNESLDTLRTPFPLTKEQQEDWYRNEICNRQSRSRFWAITDDEALRPSLELVGYGGIENIQWENGIGEISLLIDPRARGQGYGKQAADLIITEALLRLNLFTVYAEVYVSNPAMYFWEKVYKHGKKAILPNRKYLGGVYYDSMYYSISKDDI